MLFWIQMFSLVKVEVAVLMGIDYYYCHHQSKQL